MPCYINRKWQLKEKRPLFKYKLFMRRLLRVVSVTTYVVLASPQIVQEKLST